MTDDRTKRERWAAWCKLASRDRIGPELERCTFANFHVDGIAQRTAYAAMCNYARNLPAELESGSGLVLHGPTGRGKDHLAIAVLKYAVAGHGYTGAWMNCVDWFSALREAVSSGEKRRRLISRQIGPDLLVISELVPPSAELTAFQTDCLYELVDNRSRLGRPIIATCNVSDQRELAQRIGPQIAGRLIDRSMIIECAWPMHRKPKRVIRTGESQDVGGAGR